MIEQIISDFADKHLCSGFIVNINTDKLTMEAIFEGEPPLSPLSFDNQSFKLSVTEDSLTVVYEDFSYGAKQGEGEKIERVFEVPVSRKIDLDAIHSSFDKNFSGANARRGEEVSFDDLNKLIDDVNERTK